MVTKKLLKFREIGRYPLRPISSVSDVVAAAEEAKSSADVEAEAVPPNAPPLAPSESVMQEYTCCICLEIMIDPTSLPCGQ
jgi:hypothetical protein